MSRYRDFDANRKEKEPITFTAAGHEYTVKGSLPASVILDIEAMQSAEDTATQEAQGIKVARQALGNEQFERLAATTDLDQFSEILQWLMDELMGAVDEEEQETPKDQDKPPVTLGQLQATGTESPSAPPPSSNTGGSSKRTLQGIGVAGPPR